MKRRIIIFGILCLLLTKIPVQGQETQVKVLKGKVRAQSDTASVTVAAGQKGILWEGKNPMVAVDEPMVNDIIEMYRWIEEEKTSENPPFKFSSIQMVRIDSEKLWKAAGLMEGENKGTEPIKTIRIGPTSILEEPQYYDIQGNLLPYELEQINNQKGYYHLHFTKPIPPGEKVRFTCLSQYKPTAQTLWKEDGWWQIRLGNDSRNFLNYYRIILPESAIFMDSSRPVMLVDTVDGKTTITIRNLTGEQADGTYQMAFLWPDKDGTKLTDIPSQYRGMRNPRDLRLSEEYRRQMQNIFAGHTYEDQNTPFGAILTKNCAVVHKDINLLIRASYLLHKNPQLIEQMGDKMDQIWETMNECIDTEEFLSTPVWPEEPEDGYIHPLYTCRKGSLIREDTLACIYEDGRWYQFGNMGNPWDTDVSVFKKHILPTDAQVKLDEIPWDNAGAQAVEVYQEFIKNQVADPQLWCTMGIKLVGGNFWEEALDAFVRCERLHQVPSGIYYFAALVWQGHIYDYQGQRERAIEKYKVALQLEDYGFLQHDQWGIVLNYQWVKDRLEEPFAKTMIGK